MPQEVDAVDRSDFERLRELRPKTITGDIALVGHRGLGPIHEAVGIVVHNASAPELRLAVRWNPETERKTINAYILAVGPICRMDVNAPPHGLAGRSHKHSLQTQECPSLNLPIGVNSRPELSGLDVKALFLQFCREAGIDFEGSLLVGH